MVEVAEEAVRVEQTSGETRAFRTLRQRTHGAYYGKLRSKVGTAPRVQLTRADLGSASLLAVHPSVRMASASDLPPLKKNVEKGKGKEKREKRKKRQNMSMTCFKESASILPRRLQPVRKIAVACACARGTLSLSATSSYFLINPAQVLECSARDEQVWTR